MSREQNITLADGWFKGEDKDLVFNIVDANGDAQTMTGWALEWVLRATLEAPSASLTKTTSSGITIGNGTATDDRATVSVADTDTDGLPAGRYQYAVKRTDAGNEAVLVHGYAELRESATR